MPLLEFYHCCQSFKDYIFLKIIILQDTDNLKIIFIFHWNHFYGAFLCSGGSQKRHVVSMPGLVVLLAVG